MKIRLKDASGKLWETTIEQILTGAFPARSTDGPPIVSYDLFCHTAKDGTDIFVGDKVIVRGTKRVGEYETEVIIRNGDVVLALNKTYLIDAYAKSAILRKL